MIRPSVILNLGTLFLLTCGLARPSEGAAPDSTTPAITGSVQEQSTQQEGYGCLLCHADKRRAYRLGVHSERGVQCHHCHGGDTSAFTTPEAHSGGFRAALGKLETVEVCSSCHGDPDQMRQYGLPADEIAELRTSRHGQLLLDEGNQDAPTCSDCHDPHTTLRPDDARSGVHPLNISATCSGCHDDERLMAKYGIPTGQVEAHRNSAHGIALYEDENFAAPTCVGCHGSHAALPPNVTEISNVCGRCHVNVRRAFDLGPHGRLEGGEAPLGCTGCHSNHRTERVPVDRIAETCEGCHGAGSAQAILGEEVEGILRRSVNEIDRAREALLELVRGGHEISDERFRFRGAMTDFRRLEKMQHSLDIEQMTDVARLIASASLDIRGKAEVSVEEDWEHRLFLLPVWFFALGIIFLAAYRFRQIGSEAPGEPGTD
jgi:hypothetical protein